MKTSTRTLFRAFWALLISVVLAFTVACSSVAHVQHEPTTPAAVTASADVEAPDEAEENAAATADADFTDPFTSRSDNPDGEVPLTLPASPAPVPDAPPGCPTD